MGKVHTEHQSKISKVSRDQQPQAPRALTLSWVLNANEKQIYCSRLCHFHSLNVIHTINKLSLSIPNRDFFSLSHTYSPPQLHCEGETNKIDLHNSTTALCCIVSVSTLPARFSSSSKHESHPSKCQANHFKSDVDERLRKKSSTAFALALHLTD